MKKTLTSDRKRFTERPWSQYKDGDGLLQVEPHTLGGERIRYAVLDENGNCVL